VDGLRPLRLRAEPQPGGWRITAQTLTARWAGGNRQILQPDQGGTFLD
jgi:hypothetical protein